MAGAILPSFPVYNFVPTVYPGDLTGMPIWLLSQPAATNNAGQRISLPQQSIVVNTTYNWGLAPLGNAQAVSILFQSAGGTPAIDKIIMVYVNNADNVNDVTIYFPDTGMFVTCPAGSAGYYPVFTHLLACYVYNGYTGLPLSNVGLSTQIMFCNFGVPGFLSQRQTTAINSKTSTLIIPNGGYLETILPDGFTYNIYDIEIQLCAAGATAPGSLSLGVGLEDPTLLYNIAECDGWAIASAASEVVPINCVSRRVFSAPLLWRGELQAYVSRINNINNAIATVSISWTAY